MEWTDEAIVLGTRKHGETAVLLEVMTRRHGRYMGLVRGGRSRRMQPVLQPGNAVTVTWRARLESHMGQMSAELINSHAAKLMSCSLGTYGMQFIAELTRLLPERDPHPYLYQALSVIVDELEQGDIAGELMVRYELAMLTELGYGLDLDQCAATGTTEELIYVSPKSGRAVCREAGHPYHERMLPLPAFLKGETKANRLGYEDIADGFRLSGYFLDRHIYQPAGLKAPDMRSSFLEAVKRDLTLDD